MGIFWDLMQESKLKEQKEQAESLEERVRQLEEELAKTNELLAKTLIALEEHLGKDIDGDGKLGG
jgi:DNA-binding protein H-NS